MINLLYASVVSLGNLFYIIMGCIIILFIYCCSIAIVLMLVTFCWCLGVPLVLRVAILNDSCSGCFYMGG
jgi:hypothetical protein